MKWRSSVLITALVVVPLVATFSHLVPSGVRRAASANLWQPVRRGILALLDEDTESTNSVPSIVPSDPSDETDRRAERLVQGAPVALPAVPLDTTAALGAPEAHGTTATVAAVSFTSPPVADPPVAPPAEPKAQRPPASPEAVADALVASTRGSWAAHVAGAQPPVAPELPSGFAATRAAVERQLAELGALGFDFIPADPGCPRHRCSCRLPADPSGQLQRVFQSANEDPEVALGQLVVEVKAWQRRSLAGAAPGMPATAGGTVRR